MFIGVGVGPGHERYLTLEATRAIKEAQVLIFPGADKGSCRAYAIVEHIVDEANQQVLFNPFPMTMDKELLDAYHDKVASLVKGYLDKQLDVAFLTIGDATIYSTFSYIRSRIEAAGYECKIVNGISAINASAARLGISLADGSEQIHIIPGSADISSTLDYKGTKVYMKSGKQLESLLELLSQRSVSVMAVSNCGMPDEQVYYDIGDIPTTGGYLTTVIVKDL